MIDGARAEIERKELKISAAIGRVWGSESSQATDSISTEVMNYTIDQ